jgi:P pilus assembly chaperone PapD
MSASKKFIFAVFFLIASTYSFDCFAQNIIITPNRVIFDGNKRKEEVIVNNPSNETQTYRIIMENKRMLDDGRYEDIKEGEEDKDGKYAKDLIRFSPRSFTIEPKTSQTIRLQLTKPENLPEGEYRSHMKVAVVPKTEAPKVQNKDSVNIKIQVFYGVTIPIIVRNGDNLSYQTEISEAKIEKNEKNEQVLKVKVTRTGNRSVFGDLAVNHIGADGKTTVLKFLPGVSVFTPNAFRNFDLPLDIPKDLDIKKGSIEISYTDRESGKVSSSKTIK